MNDTPVVYEVRRFEVPDGPLLCSRFVDGLGYMIAFKNRVLDFVTELSETLANAPPRVPTVVPAAPANRRMMKFPITKDKMVRETVLKMAREMKLQPSTRRMTMRIARTVTKRTMMKKKMKK